MTRMGWKSGRPARHLLLDFIFLIKYITMNTLGPRPRPAEDVDEALAAFESVPLFMKSVPEDDTKDPTLSALQSLIYEGTPDGG